MHQNWIRTQHSRVYGKKIFLLTKNAIFFYPPLGVFLLMDAQRAPISLFDASCGVFLLPLSALRADSGTKNTPIFRLAPEDDKAELLKRVIFLLSILSALKRHLFWKLASTRHSFLQRHLYRL